METQINSYRNVISSLEASKVNQETWYNNQNFITQQSIRDEYQEMINSLTSSISTNKDEQSKVKEKLDKLLEFNDQSTSYFNEAEASKNLFNEGLQSLGGDISTGNANSGSWNGHGFTLQKRDWQNRVNEKWQEREEKLKTEKIDEVAKKLRFINYDSEKNISEIDYEAMIKFANSHKDKLSLEEKEILMKIHSFLKTKQYEGELTDVESRALISLIYNMDLGKDKINYVDGQYKVECATKETGANLNSLAAKIPGFTSNKMRNAVLKKYGSIDESAVYDFEFINVVTPFGKGKGGQPVSGWPSNQWSGKVSDMKCTKKR